MTIAKENALKYPKELGDVDENSKLIRKWAKDAVRSVEVGYKDYRLPCERGVWDTRDENGSLLPSDSSYACLLEPQ